MDDLISRQRQAILDALCDNCETVNSSCAHYPCKRYLAIEQLPSAQRTCDTCRYNGLEWDEEPCDSCIWANSKYEPMVSPDGTLTVTVPKGTKVTRVLVQEEGTKNGGLYYAD